MENFRKYTAIQKLRKLNAEHHAANLQLVKALKGTGDLLKQRPRGEYHKTERVLLAATATMILTTLKLDAKSKKFRIATQRLDRAEKKFAKEAAGRAKRRA